MENDPTCPCRYISTPCQYACSCAYPLASGGCLNCAKYGNWEQRKQAAEIINNRRLQVAKLQEENERLEKTLNGSRMNAEQKNVIIAELQKETERLKRIIEDNAIDF